MLKLKWNLKIREIKVYRLQMYDFQNTESPKMAFTTSDVYSNCVDLQQHINDFQ